MSKKHRHSPGLFLRGDTWHIDKMVLGRRVCESTGESEVAKAEEYLAQLVIRKRNAKIHGDRPVRTFEEAAARYIEEKTRDGARALSRDIQDLELIKKYIFARPLSEVHEKTLEPFIKDRLRKKRAPGTINRTLAVVRRILNLAAQMWRDEESHKSWLEAAPMIRLLPDDDKRPPYQLAWDEEALFGSMLPPHQREMFRFATNTGLREQNVCRLRWEWEIKVRELGTSVFMIPKKFMKNNQPFLVVLNRFARKAIERARGKHPKVVFTMKVEIRNEEGRLLRVEHRPITKMLNSAWKRARRDAVAAYAKRIGRRCPEGFAKLRPHDARHTFGYRLRGKDVTEEDRQQLMGHKNRTITTHYSAAEVRKLIEAVEKIAEMGTRRNPAITVISVQQFAELCEQDEK